MGRGDHSETLLLIALTHVILESALGPNPSFFLFLGDF